MRVPEKLKEINSEVEAGKKPSETVRSFLWWFLAQRRGWRVVRDIRGALASLKLKTIPDFEYAYIDQRVSFVRVVPEDESATETEGVAEDEQQETTTTGSGAEVHPEEPSVSALNDPTYRIGKLPAANKKPLSVKPDSLIREAITLMIRSDFSQLPVMTTDREVKGMFSWKSLASRTSLGRCGERVSDFMDPHTELSSETSIFAAVQVIAEAECALIRDQTRLIAGLITTYDLALQFGQLGEPFLLLGEIENHVRNLIEGKFTLEQLVEVRDPSDSERAVESVSDLTFGEYVRLLEKPERWDGLDLEMDRAVFTHDLTEIRRIRNDVMHFDPDGISGDDLNTLRTFSRFLARVQQLRPM